MPRKKKMLEVKKIQRKCCVCEKRRTVAFTKTIVPSYKYELDIPIWDKKSPKTRRVDLKGERKCDIYYYCADCVDPVDTSVPERDDDDFDFS